MLSIPERRALRLDVRDALTLAVMQGRFQPGDRIVESQVARELSVSQTTVREALRELESTGLVVYQINRGCIVRKLSRQDTIEMYDMRALLEGRAAQEAVTRLGADDLDALDELVADMIDQAEAGNATEMSHLDVRFHQTIVEAAGSKLLTRLWLGINPALWTHLAIVGILGLPATTIAERHRPVVEALRSKSPSSAQMALVQHMVELRELAARNLTE